MRIRSIAIAALLLPLAAPLSAQEIYEIVILNGRVVDPESGRDQIANVGIRAGQIAAVAVERIRGRIEIDATGLIVAPGFIDILGSVRAAREAHIQKVSDGVTTSFGMHGGPLDVAAYQQARLAAGPLVNYAATVGHAALRQAAGATDGYEPATPEQIERMKELAGEAIRAGAVGIGFGINYTPGASYEEVFALFEVAAQRGIDIGFDFHVWTRNQTGLQSALYNEGWQERFGGITYSDIYVAETQERLTRERFEELRAAPAGVSVQTEFIPEEEIEMALRSTLGIVSSDGGGLRDGKGHPRSVGTFSRFLGRYVREKKVLDWMEGLRRITVLPASRLERAVPRMKLKGRLQVGMDADITVFDPESVRERATYSEPYHLSEGIMYVLVNGSLVMDGGRIVEEGGVAPGQWLRHPHR